MWHSNKTVSRTYTSKDPQNCHAVLSGISGWKKIKTGNEHGVSNIFTTLNAARAGGKRVDVYIIDDMIERVVMR